MVPVCYGGPVSEKSESDVVAELRAALKIDPTRLGDVYRGRLEGKSAEEIAEGLGVSTSGFVSNNKRHIQVIEAGDYPSGATIIGQCLSVVRGFLDRHAVELSTEAQALLRGRIRDLEALYGDVSKAVFEDEQVRERAKISEAEHTVGIYVYTLPHYYRHPIKPAESDDSSDKTYMKIGMSDSDVMTRFRSQKRDTVLPEDPWLLRIYSCESDTRGVEREIHDFLRSADHLQVRGRASGTEWFCTSLTFLDHLAAKLKLRVVYRIEDLIDETDSEA